jgi:hypothetical protein
VPLGDVSAPLSKEAAGDALRLFTSKTHAMIVLEDLSVRAMSRSTRGNRSTLRGGMAARRRASQRYPLAVIPGI